MQAAPDDLLVVADIVGPTVLGQGTASGRRCSLVRLGGCNLTCSWCDSPFTWDNSRYDLNRQLARWSAAEVARTALSCAPSLVVLTGGEPLLQQRAPGWRVLLDSLAGVDVALETNGTIAPSDDTLRGVNRVTVSPKLAHGGDPSWERIKGDVLVRWGRLAQTHEVEFLFVVKDPTDIGTITTLVQLHELPQHRVWVSPEGTTAVAVVSRLHEVAETALAAGFNVAPRIVNPFGGVPAAQRVAAAMSASPATGSMRVQLPEPERRAAPVGSRFRRT